MKPTPEALRAFPLKGACLRTGKAGSVASRWRGDGVMHN